MRTLLVLLIAAAAGCAGSAQLRDAHPSPSPAADFHRLCTDLSTQSMCTGAEPTPIQIDTNLATPTPSVFVG